MPKELDLITRMTDPKIEVGLVELIKSYGEKHQIPTGTLIDLLKMVVSKFEFTHGLTQMMTRKEQEEREAEEQTDTRTMWTDKPNSKKEE